MGGVDTVDVVLLVVCAVTIVVLAGCAYALAGGPALWGPWRGVPMCGHPFEQTFTMDPYPSEWTCPKCATPFRVDGGHWVPARRWGRAV